MTRDTAAARETASGSGPEDRRDRTVGVVYGLSAYLLWGFLPLYFLLLLPMGPWELVGWRIALAFAVCVLLLAVTRSWGRIAAILRRPRLLAWTAVAGVLIYVNWQVFILGALTGHVLDASLGYFINPIVTVLLAVVVLHERLRLTQWVALGIAGVAVVVIVLGYGEFPWIALTLAFTFGFYGLVKKRIGGAVDAVSGLTLESLWLLPIAAAQLIVVAATTGLAASSMAAGQLVLLSLIGVVTATPLLLFAASARRVPLSVLGILQFAAPILQFVVGAWVQGEPMSPQRWVGFALVWVALVVLTVDQMVASRRARGISDVAPLT